MAMERFNHNKPTPWLTSCNYHFKDFATKILWLIEGYRFTILPRKNQRIISPPVTTKHCTQELSTLYGNHCQTNSPTYTLITPYMPNRPHLVQLITQPYIIFDLSGLA
jgi:hypothetical protein